jgi:hypothetical protein
MVLKEVPLDIFLLMSAMRKEESLLRQVNKYRAE